MSESKRRKDICVECSLLKPIKAKQMCQNCWHKFKRKHNVNFYLRTRYTELKQRCISNTKNCSKYYYGLKYCTLDEFLSKFLNNSEFLDLFTQWQQSNFVYSLAPSIDRIDKSKGYIIDNLQFITHGFNATKDNENRIPIDVYTRDGVLLKSFDSLNSAVDYYQVQQSNAWKVLYGKRNHTKNLVFKRRTVS